MQKQSSSSQAQTRRRLFAAIPDFPLPNQKVVVKNYDVNFGTGTIRVRAHRDTDATKRMVAIIREETDPVYNEPMPPRLPAAGTGMLAGYTELMQQVNPESFKADDVPVLGLAAVSPVANNKRVFIGCYDVNDALLGDVDSVPFMAFPTMFPVVVDARCTLWLTFADDDAELANHEKPPEYRPRALLVPATDGLEVAITKVELAARTTDRWQKGPNLALVTDANGLAGSEAGLADLTYKTAGKIHSQDITGGDFRKGELVALWDYGAALPTTEKEVGLPAVGAPRPTLDVEPHPASGARPSRLQLAFHDGVQWSNNTGSVVVQVSWKTA